MSGTPTKPVITRPLRILIGVVIFGVLVIAGIGFAGSYAAVQALAIKKGFGAFAHWFPIGLDAGIVVLLALDLMLTWLRIGFPMLRQTAWLLTAATIAFNGAASWPDPLGVAMHGVIPILFVVSVEAARHAIGRIADITADRHMDSVRFARWFLAPVPTFKLWRRMKLWELRSYDEAIQIEQDRLLYQARLQAKHGRRWRKKLTIEELLPLRMLRHGVRLPALTTGGHRERRENGAPVHGLDGPGTIAENVNDIENSAPVLALAVGTDTTVNTPVHGGENAGADTVNTGENSTVNTDPDTVNTGENTENGTMNTGENEPIHGAENDDTLSLFSQFSDRSRPPENPVGVAVNSVPVHAAAAPRPPAVHASVPLPVDTTDTADPGTVNADENKSENGGENSDDTENENEEGVLTPKQERKRAANDFFNAMALNPNLTLSAYAQDPLGKSKSWLSKAVNENGGLPGRQSPRQTRTPVRFPDGEPGVSPSDRHTT
ncbi:DUF2637 domain-containing protein (plasmid) [Streptomyces sp. NBC_01298]|uniref:DUF2637 domain-containing protein n=1 Tax=Streptomyces sp. NBC_01298 TaxID=2903817 RepID=UPI002E156D53|nr:DUF2637 domain-containing protein [Streptomyces sp. NBC_01298]